jgi:hypothetical protein
MAQDDSSNHPEDTAAMTPRADSMGEVPDPRADDEVDPELLSLSRPRRRRHPLISAVVILMGLYLMYFVRADLRYFFQARTPRDVGEVSEALAAGRLVPNQYVTLRGAPDRKHAILLKRQLSGWDSFVRLLQSDDRVYVQRHRRVRMVDREVVGVHTGRLVPFGSLAYRESVRAYLERMIVPEHEVSFEQLLQAKGGDAAQMTDKRGRKLDVSADSEFWINVAYPDEWVVQLAKSVHPTADDARKQLEGLTLPRQLMPDDSKMFWRFIVLARGDQLQQLLEAFSKPEKNAGVIRRQVSYTAKWNELTVEGDALLVDNGETDLPGPYRLVSPGDGAQGRFEVQREGPLRLPRETLLHISTTSRFELPDHALVLIVGDRPDDYWHYLLLYCLLGVFVVLNGWALIKWSRRRRVG